MTDNLRPDEIEARSFEIIRGLLAPRKLDPLTGPVVLRAIHASADLDYADNLVFSEGAVERGLDALGSGCTIITDTQMAKSGINKAALEKLGGRVLCFMSDPDVADEARRRGVTRASVSMERAAALEKPCIFAVGNAPTALIRIKELADGGDLRPALVIGVPVGFVNVVESKELILSSSLPHIVARGQKGGSGVAAAIVNALIYRLTR